MPIRPSLQEHLAKAARAAGFEAALDRLLAEARECAWMVPASQAAEGGRLVSKIGGRPDLPEDVVWPSARNEAGEKEGDASFVAQVNLEDAPEIEGLPLPKRGGLWLFLPAWHHGPEVEAVYRSEPAGLRQCTGLRETASVGFGSDVTEAKATGIAFAPGVSLPMFRQSFLDELREVLGGANTFSAWERFRRHLEPAGHVGHLGGYCQSYDQTDINRHAAFRRLGHVEHRAASRWESLEAYERELTKLERQAKDAAARRPKGLFAGCSPEAQLAAMPGKLLVSYQKLRPSVEWMDAHRQELLAEAESLRLLGTWTSGLLRLGEGMALDVLIRKEDLASGRFGDLTAECPMVG